jgi:hypothetical protein
MNAVQRFTVRPTHGWGLVAYAVVGLPVAAWAFRTLGARAERWTRRRRTDVLVALIGLGVLALAFAALYPLANSGRIGPGSDRDDALNIGVAELAAGHYPYYARTYLGAPLTPLPGALALAAPFYVLGNAAYQNVFWIAAFGWLLASASGSWRVATALVFGVLLGSPELLREFVTGGDLGANAIYVLVFAQLLVWALRRPDGPAWRRGLAALAFGVALASRPNWALLVPLVLAASARPGRWRAATLYVSMSVIAAAALTLPFYLYDPRGFSPLHVAGFIGYVDEYIPHGSHAVYALTVAAALALAVRQYRLQSKSAGGLLPDLPPEARRNSAWLFLHAAAIEALPALVAAAVLAVNEGVFAMRSEHATSRALQFLSTGHVYVYAMVYAWALWNRPATAPASGDASRA